MSGTGESFSLVVISLVQLATASTAGAETVAAAGGRWDGVSRWSGMEVIG